MNHEILHIEQLSKTFSGGIRAVDDVSLSVPEGEVFGFLGPNGAGKTTTIRLMLGLLRLDSGRVSICGVDVHGGKKYEALKCAGALVEGPAFYPYLSGLENLRVFAGYSGGVTKGRIRELIELVGLKGREKERVAGYSLGMKQRLGIAQALLSGPRLLILDEPTNGLDPIGVRDIRTLIARLSGEQGTTVFLSSHILSEVQQTCDSVAIINGGRIVASGRVKDLLSADGGQYEVGGTDRSVLLSWLSRRSDCRVLSQDPLRIHLVSIRPEDLLQEMVLAGLNISVFRPHAPTLEEFFFDAIPESTGKGAGV